MKWFIHGELERSIKMNEGFMYVEGSEIVINTRSVQVASIENDRPVIINDQEVSLKKVELSNIFIHEFPIQ